MLSSLHARALKYAFVLAVGAAIGAYIVLSLEDRHAQREATAADFEPAPPATANVEQLPLAEKAPRSGDTDAPSETRAASKPTSPVSPPSREVIPPRPRWRSHLRHLKTTNLRTSPRAPPRRARGTDVAAGTQLAALTSDEVCLRDTNRFTQIIGRLRVNPSSEELRRFADELGCEELRPDLKLLIESLDFDPPTPAALPLDTSHANPLLRQACTSERSALDRLRQEPSADAAGQFWRDMQCEGLRPQVRRLLESLNVTPDPVGSAARPREPKARGVL